MDDDGNSGDFQPITVDVEALRAAAFEEGYRKGLREAEEKRFYEGYREGLGDLVERLRAMQRHGEWEECISMIEAMRKP
jgi:hypothetical protein